MRIPKGVPDPGRVARKVTGPVTGAPPSTQGKAERKDSEGLGAYTAPPSSRSTAGLMFQALMETHKAATADLRSDREAGTEAHSAKIETMKEKKGGTAEKQEQERDAAWVNVAIAVASAGASAAAAGIGASVTGTSAAPAALQRLAIGQRKALVDTIGAVKQGATDAAKAAFAQVADGAELGDINSLIQHVLRESYLETNKDLAFYADKVKTFNDQKQTIRDQISQAGSGGSSPSLADEMKRWEEQLQTVGDDAQLANVDLQNMLQKQQQTMQMMSQISKTLHDTAMAVIRKIGG